MDWAMVPDGPAAPAGWEVIGFTSNFGDKRSCKDGWNAFANKLDGKQGKLRATMKWRGRATVKYKDCNQASFVGLYLNGVRKDQAEPKDDNPRTYRCSAVAAHELNPRWH